MENKAINLVIEKLSEICNRRDQEKSPPDGDQSGIATPGGLRTFPEPESAPPVVIEINETNDQSLFYCSECGYSSHNKYYLKQHVDLVHNSKRPYKCPFCDYAGKRSYALKEHLIVHSSDRPHQCSQCLATFRKKGHLTNHVKMHQNQLSCSICKVTCKGKHSLLTHLQQQHSSDDEQVFACDQCLFASNNNLEMMRHIQRHVDPHQVVLIKCSECGFTCGTAAEMEKHMVAVHLNDVEKSLEEEVVKGGVVEAAQEAESESLYSCGVCGFSTNDEPRMTDHMASHVLRKAPSKPSTGNFVDISGKFTYNPTLKTFACSICSYTCDQQRTIKSHIWKHSGHKDILYPMFRKDEKDNVDNPTVTVQKRVEVSSVSNSTVQNVSTQPLTEVLIPSSGNDSSSSVEKSGKPAEVLKDQNLASPMDIPNRAAVIAQIVSHDGNDSATAIAPIRKRRASDSVLEAKRFRSNDVTASPPVQRQPVTPFSDVTASTTLPSSGKKVVVIQNEHTGETMSLSAIQENQNLKIMLSAQGVERTSCVDSEEKELTMAAKDADQPTEQPVVDTNKRSGICSSLLAVIEQLRERSGNDDVTDGAEVEIRPNKEIVVRASSKSTDNWDSNNVEKLSDGQYRCRLCHYQSFHFNFIRQHMKMHKIKQPFECSLCDFIAEDSSKLQDHMLLHCKVRTYQCRSCPATFPYKSQLRAHQRAHTEEPFVCETCGFETSSPLTFRSHIRTHSQSAGSDDEAMEQNTIEEAVIDTAQSVQISDSGTTAAPSVQTDSMKVNSNKGNEEIVKKPVPTTMFVCDECEFKSDDLEKLKDHFVVEHATAKGVIVAVNKDTPPVNKLPSLRLAENYPPSNVQVVKKPDVETKKVMLQNKPKVVDVPSNLQCNLCEFTAISVRSLKSHMKRHINDQRFVEQPLEQYKCALCGYVCQHLPSLKSHMWRHASEDKYSYHRANDVINAAIDRVVTKTADEEKLGSHGNSKMETFLTFRCCQCGFESKEQSTLTAHMKKHQDVIAKTLEV